VAPPASTHLRRAKLSFPGLSSPNRGCGYAYHPTLCSLYWKEFEQQALQCGHRDRLTIRWTPEEVWTTVLSFSRMDPELARETCGLGKDARDWKVTLAQEDLRRSGPKRKHVVPILYRPFDVRYTQSITLVARAASSACPAHRSWATCWPGRIWH